ncbi:MAG: Phosphatidylglycerol--prolipoprotein diacylglyceryl transferase [Legionellaceae bacterium]
MLQYPEINPIALQLGPLKVYWYGLMYLIGIFSSLGLALLRNKQAKTNWSTEQISDLIFFAAIGIIFGGRIGYMVFYNLPELLTSPWILFKIWEGGMSFHGGLLGVLISLWVYSRKFHRSFFELTDLIAPLAPIGLGAGRIGNFINAELWGRTTTVPWAMVYPNSLAGYLPRHPSALYEALMEGLLLFIILWIFSSKPKPRMAVSALFLICYGIFRTIAECFRQPDPQLGFIAFDWFTMGQLLSLPMIAMGIYLLFRAYQEK